MTYPAGFNEQPSKCSPPTLVVGEDVMEGQLAFLVVDVFANWTDWQGAFITGDILKRLESIGAKPIAACDDRPKPANSRRSRTGDFDSLQSFANESNGLNWMLGLSNRDN